MATGLSIHIGLNEIDPKHYGSPWPLRSCVADAHAMHELAVRAGFEPLSLLLGPQATADAVLDAIRAAARRLDGDGILLLTYAGHGGQVRDVCGDEGGPNCWDETWCTYDRQLIDDELKACWPDFAPGARVLVVSDSCFSGDMIRLAPGEAREPVPPARKRALLGALPVMEENGGEDLSADGACGGPALEGRKAGVTRGGRPALRALSARVTRRVYGRHKKRYDHIQQAVCPRLHLPIQAQVLLLAASQENEPARDGETHGAFTAALLETWDEGRFQGSYRALYNQIFKCLAPRQHPAILALKPPAFANQRPFTI